MELRPGVAVSAGTPRFPRFLGWPALALAVGALLLALALAPAARAAVTTPSNGAPPGTPVLVTALNRPPAGYRLTAAQVLRIARADPEVQAKLRSMPRAVAYEYTRVAPTWQVSWFSPGRKQRELMQVYVDDGRGRVIQVWTGHQVAWTMARGYPGAFGRRADALYVWIPLCLFFLVPFLPWPRLRRSGWRLGLRRPRVPMRPTLLHLDLLMLLGFSVSLAFFNRGEVGVSVPLVYPFLLYLLVRMLLLAFGRGVPRGPLPLAVSIPWLLSGAAFLLALRVGLNILNSNVIDVGYAGVIGANKVIHGQLLYGFWPSDNSYGDTYAPLTYYAYIPFRLIFGWSGTWDALPAAHAASIFFDLLTAGGLYALGRRWRDHALGVVLLYAWVAYPFTLFTLNSNSNDSLVAALVVLALLVVGSAPARGVAGALAGLTKFAPFALAPLLMRGVGPRPKERSVAIYIVAFAVTVFVALQPVLIHGDLNYLWRDSIVYQANRMTPFSIWGLAGGLGALHALTEGVVVAMALVLAWFPVRRGRVEVAALGAAILIAVQLTANYWLYLYLVWFFPLVVAALFAAHPERRLSVTADVPARVDAPASPQPLPIS